VRKRCSISFALGTVLTLFVSLGGSEIASADVGHSAAAAMSEAQRQQQVEQFTSRVHSKWNLNVSSNDYQTIPDGNDLLIVPKGMAAPKHVQVHGVDMLETSAVAQPRTKSTVAPLDNPAWQQPVCLARIVLFSRLDPSKVDAIADACYAFGQVTYANQLGWDAALKEYQSCSATGGDGLAYYLTACDMAFAPGEDAGFLDWDDWSPRGTITSNPCSSINLSISIAGVGAGLGINLCDTLNPVKGTTPLDFQVHWSGRAPIGQSREVGDIIGVHDHLTSFGYNVLYGGMSLHL
jgi:hypothetical protein